MMFIQVFNFSVPQLHPFCCWRATNNHYVCQRLF
jgi:hypothetical protein